MPKNEEVCSVALTAEGHLLIGKRRDNGKYTLPGGHKKESETPEAGARRETKEETGIDLQTVTALGSELVRTPSGRVLTVHSYHADLPERLVASVNQDPDMEAYGWYWEPIHQGLSRHVIENLHAPKNATLRRMGLLVY